MSEDGENPINFVATGQPAFVQHVAGDSITGTADSIEVNLSRKELISRGHASLKQGAVEKTGELIKHRLLIKSLVAYLMMERDT